MNQKKFTVKYYLVDKFHFQIWISPDKFLEAKLHKDGTYDLSFSNPKFTKPKLGSKTTLIKLIKDDNTPISKMKQDYLTEFFDFIREMAVQLSKK